MTLDKDLDNLPEGQESKGAKEGERTIQMSGNLIEDGNRVLEAYLVNTFRIDSHSLNFMRIFGPNYLIFRPDMRNGDNSVYINVLEKMISKEEYGKILTAVYDDEFILETDVFKNLPDQTFTQNFLNEIETFPHLFNVLSRVRGIKTLKENTELRSPYIIAMSIDSGSRPFAALAIKDGLETKTIFSEINSDQNVKNSMPSPQSFIKIAKQYKFTDMGLVQAEFKKAIEDYSKRWGS